MRFRTLVLTATALCAASGGTLATGAPAADVAERAAAAPARQGVVVTPRPSEVVRTHVVRLRVRAGGLASVRAHLNGVDVSDELGPSRRGIRSLRTSVSHGLRHGRNVLRVTVRPFGRPARTTTRRFAVRRADPLVGAGRDRRVVAGERITLAGRHVARDGAAATGPRWSLVRAPRGARARLASRSGRAATLTPSRPGAYTLRYTVGRGEDAVSDRVTVEAGPTSPMVPIDTMAGTDSAPSIKVGDRLYPTERHSDDGWTQVLVLDRSNLALVSNTSYGSAGDIRAALAKLDDTKLVIVAEQESGLGEVGSALTGIGVPDLGRVINARVLSAIGVPRMPVGQADWNLYSPGTRFEVPWGRMTGYLMRDAHHNYGFVPDGRRPFTYGGAQVAPCPDSAGDAHIGYRVQVQNARWPDEGFPGTFACQMFDTNARDLTAAQWAAEARRMTDVLNVVRPDDVVTIQAVSNRAGGEATYPPPVGTIDRNTMTALALAVAKAGGTRNGFNLAARVSGVPASGGAVYTLVGWGGAGESKGAEVAAGVDGAGDVPAMRGVLRPDNQSRYRPAQIAGSPEADDVLSTLVQQPPTTAWPYDDDPGVTAAIACLGGSAVLGLGENPRSAYWNQIIDASLAIEQLQAASYATVSCTGKANRFSEDDFETARAQLEKELGWVGHARDYLTDVSQSVATSGLEGWAKAKSIGDTVYSDALDPKGNTAWQWVELVGIFLKGLGPFSDGWTTVMGSVLDTAVWGFGDKANGNPSYAEVQTDADALGLSFISQAENARQSFGAMGDVIMSDYSKLRTVGTCGGSAPSGCAPGWKFGQEDLDRASSQVEIGIERLAYTKLLPLGYHVFELAPTHPLPSQPDPHWYRCYPGYYPYENIPPAASTSLLSGLGEDEGAHQWQTFVLAVPPTPTQLHGVAPPDAVLSRMFGPLDPAGDPTKGGLGMTMTGLVQSTQSGWDWWEGDEHDERALCE